MREHCYVGALAIVILGLCFTGIAYSQVQPWDENRVSWTAPTTNTDGTALTNLTGYRVERSASSGGAYTTVGTATGITFTHAGATAGVNCYRVIALTPTAESMPSNVACKTNVRPTPVPSPPTNLRFTDTVAFDIRKEGGLWHTDRAVAVVKDGAVPVSRYAIDGKQGYCQVRRADTVTVKASKGVLVAACATA